jgi:SanA protein
MAEAAPRRPGPKLWRILLGTAVGLVLIVGGANIYIVAATSADIVGVVEAPRRPVAIVLGNLVYPNGHVSVDLRPRVQTALELYQAGKVERLFLSGLATPVKGYDEPAEMATWLERRGVPRSAMILDREGYRTVATMANAARNGVVDALICTQPYHLPRAVYIARHAGIRALGVTPANPLPLRSRLHALLREAPARTESLAEIAFRGVRAD